MNQQILNQSGKKPETDDDEELNISTEKIQNVISTEMGTLNTKKTGKLNFIKLKKR